ncbi:MAG: prepilin-type N-terminal cleavage/methylation domain-containing protein [Nitrospirota bacterium]
MPILRAGTLTRTDSLELGFTLLEVIIVLSLLGLVVGLVFPLIGLRDPLRDTSRQIIGRIHSLRDAAVSSKDIYRLNLDIDQQIYWVTMPTADKERVPSDASLGSSVSLSDPVRFGEITTFRHGKAAAGRVFIDFFPNGRVDPTVIILSNQDGRMLSLRLDRFSGHVQITDQEVGLSPPPIPPALLSLFRPLRPVSAGPRMRTI